MKEALKIRRDASGKPEPLLRATVVEANEDGTARLRLEAYTQAEVIKTRIHVPNSCPHCGVWPADLLLDDLPMLAVFSYECGFTLGGWWPVERGKANWHAVVAPLNKHGERA